MKKYKKTILITIFIKFFFTLPNLIYAQNTSFKKVFAAKTEEEMYNIYTQFIDSSSIYKELSFSYINDFNSNDTIMKIEQLYGWHRGYATICKQNRNRVYISSNMQIDFYERFYHYLDSLRQKESYYSYFLSVVPLYFLRRNFIKLFESGKLNREDSIKTLNMIENVTIKIINDKYDFTFLYFNNTSEYMTENIRQALIKKIKHPFYPEIFLNYYMNNIVDTSDINISNIPIEIKEKLDKKKLKSLANEYELQKKYGFERISKYEYILNKYYFYKEIGHKLGISPGQAYLNKKKKMYPYKGYLDINAIADYSGKCEDDTFILYLENFQKKHPDYKLRPFR